MLAPGPVPAADEADVSVHTVFHDGDASTVKDGGQSGDSAGDLLSQKKVEDTLAASPSPNHASRKRQVFWEVLVVSALFVTYVFAYFSRDHLFVVEEEFMAHTNVSGGELGVMMAFGYAAYPLGKVVWGYVTDRYGGRTAMLVCLLGTGLASVVFSVCTNYGLFVTMWAVLRFLQPAGWTAVVQLAGSWVPHTRHGRVMGILSLSFLVGDVFARGVLAVLVARDVSWVVVVLFSGIITMTALIPWYFILKPDPTHVGLPRPSQAPTPDPRPSLHHHQLREDTDDEDVEGAASQVEMVPVNPKTSAAPPPTQLANTAPRQRRTKPPLSFSASIWRLVKHPMYLLVCAVCFAVTSVRETFNTFAVTYLEEEQGMAPGAAAAMSALLPLAGVPSTLLAGWAFDKLSPKWRGALFPVLMSLMVLGTAAMTLVSQPGPGMMGFLLFLTGFGMLGPYTLLSGAFALEIGGLEGAGLASATIDACGYIGAMLVMLVAAADVSLRGIFSLVSVLAVVTWLLGFLLWRVMRRLHQR